MAYTTTAKQFIEDLPKKLTPGSALRAVGGVVSVEIEGEDGGNWLLDLDQGKLVSGQVRPTSIIRANALDFMACIEGRMSVRDGLLSERLHLAGEVGKLSQVMALLSELGRSSGRK